MSEGCPHRRPHGTGGAGIPIRALGLRGQGPLWGWPAPLDACCLGCGSKLSESCAAEVSCTVPCVQMSMNELCWDLTFGGGFGVLACPTEVLEWHAACVSVALLFGMRLPGGSEPETSCLGSSISLRQLQLDASVSALGAPMTFGSVFEPMFHSLLDFLYSSWDAFIRTLLLFYFLSCLHLLSRQLRMRRGCYIRNEAVVATRRTFRGAPLIWAFFIVAHRLPVAVAAPKPVDNRPHAEAAYSHTCGIDDPAGAAHVGSASHASPDTAPQSLSRTFTSAHDDVFAAAAIYRFQTPTSFVDEWVGKHDSVGLVVCTFKDSFLGDDPEFVLTPVCPQPNVAQVVLLCTPSWVIEQLTIPVLIQVATAPKTTYLEYFLGRVSFEDVRTSVGALWPIGGQVYVGGACTPLDEDAFFTAQPGLLIRVLRPCGRCPAVFDLDQKLLDPPFWFRDVSHIADLDEPEAATTIGVLGTQADWLTVRTGVDSTSQRLHRFVAAKCSLAMHGFHIRRTTGHIFNVAFRGQEVSSIIGILPSALDECSCVFVDARDLAVPLKVIYLPRLLTSLDNVLQLVGACRPSGRSLRVTGCRSFEASSGTFIPDPVDCLVIRVQQRFDVRHCRSFRLNAATPPVPTEPVNNTWNRSSCGTSASPVRHSEDTSVECSGFVKGPVGRAPCTAPGTACSSALAPVSGIVECPNEAPLPVLPITAPSDRLPGEPPDDPGEDGEASEEELPTSDADVFREWRIAVSLPRAYWVASGEDVGDFLVRLEIFLDSAPPDSSHAILIPALQPPGQTLHLLRSPRWWREARP